MSMRPGLIAAAVVAWSCAAQAQGYPNRVVSLIAPFQAGGPTDVVARLVAAPMSKILGQPIMVENVSGAGGTVAAARAAKAPPDGYTLLIAAAGTHAAVEAVYPNPPYHPIDSYEAVGLINTTPVVLVGRRNLPPGNLRELIAWLKAQHGSAVEANAGLGSVAQVGCSYFRSLIEAQASEVTYRGTAQATRDLEAGKVDYLCNQIVNVVDGVKNGSVKAYAVTGDVRSPMLPEVPTTAEAGLPEFKMVAWYGIVAPKGTPKPIIDKLNHALSAALDDPVTARRFASLGFEVARKEQRSSAFFAGFMRKERIVWMGVLRDRPAAAK
jgi:tripartite-type tricarboxylate transporter receptor subunit TctC